MADHVSNFARALCTLSLHDYKEIGREPQTEFHRNILEEECTRCGFTRRRIKYWSGHEPDPYIVKVYR